MTKKEHPSLGNGKICYLEIPALDIKQSADFYKKVFGWQSRTRGDGSIAFDDGVGEVSGAWVLGRKPTTEIGLLIYIMVDSAAGTMESVAANGGKIVQQIGADAPEITARFTDPSGNILGLYQEPVPESLPDREIISTRVTNAPRELVWKAWTDPKHLAQWWGPNGFTNTFHEFDEKPGGHWRYVMHSPDGHDYKNHSVVLVTAKPERIVLEHLSSPQFLLVATFKEEGGKTKISFRQIFRSAAECEKMKPLCVSANEQNLDRLEAQLKKMS
jgi:uncharacterized protein YndB with AHSA1/START domain/predicted enzyme related to lactoylglutathione lyase